jgi:hypothetical protein
MKQLKLWGAVGIMLIILAALFYTDLKAYERGYNKKAMEVSKAQENAHSIAKNVHNQYIRKTDKEIEKALDKWYRD